VAWPTGGLPLESTRGGVARGSAQSKRPRAHRVPSPRPDEPRCGKNTIVAKKRQVQCTCNACEKQDPALMRARRCAAWRTVARLRGACCRCLRCRPATASSGSVAANTTKRNMAADSTSTMVGGPRWHSGPAQNPTNTQSDPIPFRICVTGFALKLQGSGRCRVCTCSRAVCVAAS
jgi:hypothetical protein